MERTPPETLFPNKHVKIDEFMYWLYDLGKGPWSQLLRHILDWIGLMVDYGSCWDKLDDDKLMVPMAVGVKGCSRKLPRSFKKQVVSMYSKGKGFKSGSHAVKMMKWFRHMRGPSLRDAVGNKRAEESMRTYLHECKQTCFFLPGNTANLLFCLGWHEAVWLGAPLRHLLRTVCSVGLLEPTNGTQKYTLRVQNWSLRSFIDGLSDPPPGGVDVASEAL